MARPLRQLTPEADQLWGRALLAWEAGELTIDDLSQIVGVSQRTVYYRLAEARERRDESLTTGANRPDIDEAVWLELVWGARRGDGPTYDLRTDRTSLDDRGGVVLMTNHSGTRLKRNRLGTGDRVRDPGGPTKYQPDASGLKGGVG